MFLLSFCFPNVIWGQIKLDSLYKNQKIEISLNKIANTEKNYEFNISKNNKKIFTKNIFSQLGEIEFSDFNNDGIKDILIQNISDVRSNWTYYLFLYDKKAKTFKNVENFESVKNPTYNTKFDLIESSVVSGNDYLSFYKIRDYKTVDLNYTISDIHSKNFSAQYRKAIKKLHR